MVKGAELGQTARLPLPWQAFIDEANASEVSSVEAEWLPFQPNKVVQENELPNQGLEVGRWGVRGVWGGWFVEFVQVDEMYYESNEQVRVFCGMQRGFCFG